MSVFKVFSGAFIIRIAYTLLGALNSVLLARVLGAEGYGVYVFSLSIVALLSVPTQFGIPLVVVRDVASYRVSSSWGLIRGLVARSHQFVFCVCVLVCSLSVVWIFSNPSEYSEEKKSALLVALMLVPVLSFGALRVSMLKGFHHVIAAQLPENIIRPCLLALGLLFFLITNKFFKPSDIVLYYFFCSVLAFVFGWFFYIGKAPKELKGVARKYKTKKWLSDAFPVGITNAMQVVNVQLSMVLLSFYASDVDVGFYRVAAMGAGFVVLVLQVVNSFSAPEFSRLFSQGDLPGLERYINKVNKMIALSTLPLVLGIVIFGKWAIGVFYGPDFLSAYYPLLILVLGQMFNALMGPVGLILTMTGHQTDVTKAMGIALVLNVLLHFILMPRMGLLGAAIASSVMIVVWNILLWLRVKKRLGIKYYV